MPELPEVETTLRGIEACIKGEKVSKAVIRQRQLRLPITRGLSQKIEGQTITDVHRRGKYLLFRTKNGSLIMHFGMSGSLRILDSAIIPTKHDHFDLIFSNGKMLRFRDPRKFGTILWTQENPLNHPLIASLGPEPLASAFSGAYLYAKSRTRKTAIKNFVMNARIVSGVGNIYANEALYKANILPTRSVQDISAQSYDTLCHAIKYILRKAIKKGGTTLRDFVREDGNPGYFKLALKVYGREHQACLQCGTTIVRCILGQRSSYFCPKCQR